MIFRSVWVRPSLVLLLGAGLGAPVWAGKVIDRYGNEGYDTAEECDAAVRAGKAKFYRPHTQHPPMLREGEAGVKTMTLGELTIPKQTVTNKLYGSANYHLGACDLGAPHSAGRDGVSAPLQGKYVPFSSSMQVNVYTDKAGTPVRASMRQCDNWFASNFPRPVAPESYLQCPPPSGTAQSPVVVPDPLTPAAKPPAPAVKP